MWAKPTRIVSAVRYKIVCNDNDIRVHLRSTNKLSWPGNRERQIGDGGEWQNFAGLACSCSNFAIREIQLVVGLAHFLHWAVHWHWMFFTNCPFNTKAAWELGPYSSREALKAHVTCEFTCGLWSLYGDMMSAWNLWGLLDIHQRCGATENITILLCQNLTSLLYLAYLASGK